MKFSSKILFYGSELLDGSKIYHIPASTNPDFQINFFFVAFQTRNFLKLPS